MGLNIEIALQRAHACVYYITVDFQKITRTRQCSFVQDHTSSFSILENLNRNLRFFQNALCSRSIASGTSKLLNHPSVRQQGASLTAAHLKPKFALKKKNDEANGHSAQYPAIVLLSVQVRKKNLANATIETGILRT